MLDMEKNYKLAGYIWSFVKVDKNHAVIQSHGVTAGPWPGFKMLKFGGKDDFYATDIDGEDISAYDDKMLALYDAIKDVEDKSASYGKGLYLVSKEKAGFTGLGEPGSGNYWQTLKKAAGNASSFGAAYYSAWIGIAYGSTHAWYVNRDSSVFGSSYQDHYDYVVAPAFNLDLSKVEVVGDEIIIRENSNTSQPENQSNPAPYRSIWEYGMDLSKEGETIHLDPEMVRKVSDAVKEADGRKFVATYTSRELSKEQYIAVCDEMRDYFDSYGELGYFIIRRVLGEGFNKR